MKKKILDLSLSFKRKQGSREGNFRGTKMTGGGEGDIFQTLLQGAKINDSLGPRVGDLLDTPLQAVFMVIPKSTL